MADRADPPDGILASPDVRKHLDWDRPIGLLLCGILHYVLDEENPDWSWSSLAW